MTRRTAAPERRLSDTRRKPDDTQKHREFILSDRERTIVREVAQQMMQEQHQMLGIDAERHRQHHEWWDAQKPLLDELLPWVKTQKDISQKKLEFWTSIRVELLRGFITWGAKLTLAFLMLAVGYGALTAAGVIGNTLGLP